MANQDFDIQKINQDIVNRTIKKLSTTGKFEHQKAQAQQGIQRRANAPQKKAQKKAQRSVDQANAQSPLSPVSAQDSELNRNIGGIAEKLGLSGADFAKGVSKEKTKLGSEITRMSFLEGVAKKQAEDEAIAQGQGQPGGQGGFDPTAALGAIGSAAGSLIAGLVPRGADGNPGLDFAGDPDKKNFMANLLTNVLLFTKQGQGIAAGQLTLAQTRAAGTGTIAEQQFAAAKAGTGIGAITPEQNLREQGFLNEPNKLDFQNEAALIQSERGPFSNPFQESAEVEAIKNLTGRGNKATGPSAGQRIDKSTKKASDAKARLLKQARS